MEHLEEKPGTTANKALTQYQKRDLTDLRTGTSYRVRGKDTLDSMLAYQEANKRNISTFIVDKGQDKEKAWATVQAVHPTTGQKIEDTVFFYFDSVKDIFLLEAIESAEKYGKDITSGFTEDDRPKLQEKHQRALIRRFIRFKHFAVRDAITKAARRALLKMMNREWREDVEIGYEKMEEEIVKNSIKDSKKNSFSSNRTSDSKSITSNPVILDDTEAEFTEFQEAEVKPMPIFPEPTENEKEYNENYRNLLVDQSGERNVFPPTSLKQLEFRAGINALEFLIRDAKYQNMLYGHFLSKHDPAVTQMTVTFPDKQRITIFLNRTSGAIWIAKSTKIIYGDVLVPYFTATGYGHNWFFAPQTTYEAIKEQKKES